MLFKFLILFEVFVALSQAQVLKRYQSDTTIQVTLKASENQNVCDCKDNKCTLNAVNAGNLCRLVMLRLQFYTEPSSYFGLCEVHPRTCQQVVNNKLKEIIIDVVFDDYYLKTSPFFFGPKTGEKLMRYLMQPNLTYTDPAFQQPTLSIKQSKGLTGMPVEFWGITTIPLKNFSTYSVCYSQECQKTLNNLCDGFAQAMRKTKAAIMNQYMGCRITRIYKAGDQVRITWAMLFNHFAMISMKSVTTYEDLKKQVDQVGKDLHLPLLIKEYHLTGFKPLDYCEITASSLTTQPWSYVYESSTTYRYRTDSHLYYTRFMTQLTAADSIAEKCMRKALGLNFVNEGGKARVSIGLWASLTCYQEHGIKSCKEATERMQDLWKKGRDLMFNDWANDYKFTLNHQGKGFQVKK